MCVLGVVADSSINKCVAFFGDSSLDDDKVRTAVNEVCVCDAPVS